MALAGGEAEKDVVADGGTGGEGGGGRHGSQRRRAPGR